MAFKLRILPRLLVVIMAFCNQEVFGVNSTAAPNTCVCTCGNGSTMAGPVATPTATQTVSPSSSMAPPVFGQNNTTVAPSPSVPVSGNGSTVAGPVTTQITPTTSQTVSVTLVMVSLEVEKCNEESKKDLDDSIGALYKDPGYDFKSAEFMMANSNGEKCVFNITMKFGEELNKRDIIAQLENASTIKGKILHINAKVTGVVLGDFKATDDACKQKCCGTGGPIEVVRACTPAYKCVNYKLTKTEPNCNNVCEKICVGAMFKMSLLVLVMSGLINWFLKE